jgi:biopolymer transport protein ExbD
LAGGGRSPFGGKSMFGSEGSGEVHVDLNLTPLMDVMSNILFFLLASFGAAILSYINVSYPVQSDGEPTPMKKEQVTVNLQITPSEYKVNCSNDELPAEELAKLRYTIPKLGDGYDFKKLNNTLYEIKKQYPASETAIMVPDGVVLYDSMIRTMDAVRDITIDGKRFRLFPKMVVADLVKADTAE